MDHRLTLWRAVAGLAIFFGIGALVVALLTVPEEPMVWLDAVSWVAVSGAAVALAAAFRVGITRESGDEQTRKPEPGLLFLIGSASLVSASVGIMTGLAVLAIAALLGAAACIVLAVRSSLSP